MVNEKKLNDRKTCSLTMLLNLHNEFHSGYPRPPLAFRQRSSGHSGKSKSVVELETGSVAVSQRSVSTREDGR